MANNRINFQVGFSVDKSGLSEMQSLFQQIANKAKEPANRLDTGLQQAAKTATTLDSILEKTFNTNLGTLNVTKFNQELAKSNLTLKDVKASFSQAGSQGATAYNRLSQAILGTNLQLKESNKLLDSMATTMANTVKWGITSSIFNTITNSIQKAYTYSKQLDTSLNDIRIVTNKSADDMANFAEKANDAAKALGASTLDYSNASLIYYQQGLSDAEVAARAETTVKAANVTGQTGEEVSEQLTAVWNGYKVTAEETEAYVDKLAAVAATTAADLEELSKGMSKVAAAANAMGVDFDDLNAQIATIVSVTRQAPESVGTALKTIYARLGDLKVDGVDEFGVSLGEVSGQMQTMGIQILDQQGNLRDMSSVIAEVAQKWQDWTEAQKQAAAVAMAGKRQYNNLIALFENWGMYTDALNTSQEALGTLQQQQDIYMESTVAKLKTLKATWQDLYGDLINEDQLNTGIQGLTDLVQVFDNFIESFGGGLKSITAFGAIVANIFNKQIADAINGAIQNQQKYQQNVDLMKSKMEMIQQGTMESTGSTMRDEAIVVNTQKQLDIAKAIYDVRVGLNTEEYNNLTLKQQEVGQLAEEQKYLELQVIDQEKRILGEQEIKTLLTAEYEEAEKLRDATFKQYDEKVKELSAEEELINALDSQLQKAMDLKTTGQAWGGIKSQILQKAQAIGTEEAKIVEKILEGVQGNNLTAGIKRQIINECSKHYEKETKVLNSIEAQINAETRVMDQREKIARLAEDELNIQNQIKNSLDQASSSQNITQTIVTATSALGNMAMAWSSVQSIIKTINDDTLSFGDKLTQVLMTAGMALPMMISSFAKLKETLGITSTIFEVYRLQKEKDTAVTIANTTAQAANNATIVAGNALNTETIASVMAEISAKEAEQILTNKSTASEIIYQAAKKSGIAINDFYIEAIIASIAAKKAETAATEAATIAQNAYNASLLANPYILAAVAALTVLIGTIAAVNAHYKRLREEAHEAAEEASKLAQETRSEAEAHKELVQQFDELKEKYDAGTASKEELWEITGKLLEAYDLEGSRLDMLTGKYDKVADAIKRKQKAEQEELLQQDTKTVEASAQAVLEEGRKVGGSGRISDTQYRVTLDSGLANAPGDYAGAVKKAKEIFGEDITYSDDISEYINSFIFDTSDVKNITEGISKLEQWRDVLKDLGYETAPAYQSIENIINAFNDEGSLDTLKENQAKTLEDILSNSVLSLANTQEEFDKGIKDIQNELQNALSKGIIPSDTDIDKSIADYIGTLNTSLATNFTMEQGIKEKFGDSLNKELLDAFMSLDEDSKIKFVDLFDFSADTEKGEQLLKDYQDYFNNQTSNTVAIPVSFQTQLNEDILKGKDISKSDWKSLISSSPDAESILGDRESFNNKSIGERLTLVKELNAAIKEQNALTIEQFDISQKASENILKDLENQISDREEKIKNLQSSLINTDSKSIEETEAKIQDLQSEIEELTGEKHEIEIGLDMEIASDNILQSMVGDVVTEADQLLSATEAIGEGWTVAAENVAQFASAFPDLMADVEAINRLEDGSIQLNKDRVNEVLQGNQDIMESNKEIVLQEIDDKLAQLQAEKTYQQAKLDALNEYLEADINNEQAEADATSKIKQAAQDYADTLRENDLIDDTNAVNQAISNSETGANGMIQSLKAVNEAIKILHNNYANIMVEGAAMADITSSAGGAARASNNFSSTKNANYSGNDAAKKAAIEAAKQAKEEAENRISEINKEVAAYEGFRSDVLSRTSKANAAAERVKAGKAGKEEKGKKGGGGKDKKEKDEKEYKDEFDRYWELNKAIEETDRSMKKLEKDQKNLFGYQLIDSLKKTNKLLDAQAANYEKLAEAQQAEAAELRNQLGTMGVMFDASGAIVNYAEATAQALAAYNAAIQKYNAGLIDETTLGVAEKAYENFKKLLERYDILYYKEIEDTKEKLDDIRREKLANNLKAWEVEVDLKLNWKELKRGWNDFLKEIKKDFKSVYKDLRVETKNMAKDAKTYIGADGSIGVTIKAIKDVTKEIDKMMAGKDSKMFESVSQAQEKLKELNETLQDNAKALHDLMEQAWKEYLDGIDQVADKFDDLMDRFQKANDELEFQGQLIELLYGEKAYGLLDALYKGQEKSLGNQVQSVKQQVDMWKELFEESGASMDNQADWTEDQKKYYDEWMEAQEKLNDLVIDYIKLLKTDYLNTIDKVLSELEKAITGSSLKDVSTEWERISAYADKYLDDVEQAYETQKFANKINEQIAKTDSLKNQQKLQAFRDKEIKYLREKENLTQYDLDAAEARYQIALKEMALEDARNNKTSMKLVRNDQGNWSYQYMADEEDVQSKQQELLDAYNNLYQLASNAYESNLESLQELQEKYLESAKEIYTDETLTEEEKQQKLLELRTWYFEQYRLLAEENTLYRNDLATSASALLLEIYNQDKEAYETMTTEEQELLNNLIEANIEDYMDLEEKIKENYKNIDESSKEMMANTRADWTSTAQLLADLWNKDAGGSVRYEVVDAHNQIIKATEDYKAKVDWLANAVERNFGEKGIKGAIDKASEATDRLKDKTEDLVNDGVNYLDDLRRAVEEIEDAWNSVADAIENAIDLLEEYLQKKAEAAAADAATGSAGGGGGSGSSGGSSSSGGSGSGSGSGGGKTGSSGSGHGYTVTAEGYGGKISRNFTDLNKAWEYARSLKAGNEYGGVNIHSYDTGGYTGAWGNSGKLAVLHEKELVLNKNDTANFLEGINTLRDMTGLNGSISSAITQAVANMALALGKTKANNLNGTTINETTQNEGNTFTIYADFPNADNVNDIREALMSLPNLASQYVARNGK